MLAYSLKQPAFYAFTYVSIIYENWDNWHTILRTHFVVLTCVHIDYKLY